MEKTNYGDENHAWVYVQMLKWKKIAEAQSKILEKLLNLEPSNQKTNE